MVRVLGPIDLLTDTGVVVPNGRNVRKILGALAISVNHAVSADRLASVVWDDEPPPSLTNTLQTYIFRLREEVGHDRIAGEDHSYSLHLAPVQLDALEFERLASRAARTVDAAERIALCKQATGLWRGEPFGEFSDDDPFRLESIRLNELRLYVMELQLAAELKLGREELAVGTLAALVEDHPYRERFWYLLIESLAASGRRVEALRACSRLRELLGDVGLEPGREIRDLEEMIISEDANLRSGLRDLLAEPFPRFIPNE